MIKATLPLPLFRFLVVGGGATCLNYSVYLTLYHVLGVHYEFAFASGFITGIAFGYLFNRKWTFQVTSNKHSKDLWRYICVYVLSFGIGLAVLKIAVQLMTIDPSLANFFSICLTTCINYTGIRVLVFRQ